MPRSPFCRSFHTCCFCIALLVLQACTPAPDALPDQRKRVLLVGVDGVQLEKLQQLATPSLAPMLFSPAYAGGVTGTETQQATSSGPGWSTLLTGVWANKHRITDNSSILADFRYPSLVRRIWSQQPDLRIAISINWGNPYVYYFPHEVIFSELFHWQPGNDPGITETVVDLIANNRADVIFTHIDDPDTTGHSEGFSPAYDEELLEFDQQFGQMYTAVEQRRATFPDEEWLILIVTDHGREASGFGHGGQSLLEKTAFIAMDSTRPSTFFQAAAEQVPDSLETLYLQPSQADVMPTILDHLNIPIDPAWQLDGTSLLDSGAL